MGASQHADLSRKTRHLLLLALALSTALNVIFLVFVFAERRDFVFRSSAKQPGIPAGVGVKVPPLQPVVGMQERFAPLMVPLGRKALIYVFHPRCRFCLSDCAEISRLFEAKQTTMQTWWLSNVDDRDSVTTFLSQCGDQGTSAVAHFLNHRSAPEFDVSGTPQLLLVGTDGSVERNWGGAIRGAAAASIASDLNFDMKVRFTDP